MRNREVGNIGYRGTEGYQRIPDQPADIHSKEGKGPKGYQRSSERIKEDICEQLTLDPYIDASDVDVEVIDRNVTLSGSVPDKWMKYSAEDVVGSVPGVLEVSNNLKVNR